MHLINLANREGMADTLVGPLHGIGILLIEWAFMLVYHDAILLQCLEAVAIKFFSKQALSWPKGICGIHND